MVYNSSLPQNDGTGSISVMLLVITWCFEVNETILTTGSHHGCLGGRWQHHSSASKKLDISMQMANFPAKGWWNWVDFWNAASKNMMFRGKWKYPDYWVRSQPPWRAVAISRLEQARNQAFLCKRLTFLPQNHGTGLISGMLLVRTWCLEVNETFLTIENHHSYLGGLWQYQGSSKQETRHFCAKG